MTSRPRGRGQGSFTKLTASVCVLPYALTEAQSRKKTLQVFIYIALLVVFMRVVPKWVYFYKEATRLHSTSKQMDDKKHCFGQGVHSGNME